MKIRVESMKKYTYYIKYILGLYLSIRIYEYLKIN